MSVSNEQCATCKKKFELIEEAKPCPKCLEVFYCSKQHKKKDWFKHKKVCKVISDSDLNVSRVNPPENGIDCCAINTTAKIKQVTKPQEDKEKCSDKQGNDDSTNIVTNHMSELDINNKELDQSMNQTNSGAIPKRVTKAGRKRNLEKSSSGSKSAKAIYLNDNSNEIDNHGNKNDTETVENINPNLKPEPSLTQSIDRPMTKPQQPFCPNIITPPRSLNDIEWAFRFSNCLIHDLSIYGMCVMDNFIGKELGLNVLEEAMELYKKGAFVDGQTVNKMKGMVNSSGVRSDKVFWVTGKEGEHVSSISKLMSHMDNMVFATKKMRHQGDLAEHIINQRSHGMVACYPADGACYIKHVDNPGCDGRFITAIYYMNKDWTKQDGGILRIYPINQEQVADIEPKFDRVLFFWSDRRNPHEVQPAYRKRYAVTLWYYDEQQRIKYLTDTKNSNQVDLVNL